MTDSNFEKNDAEEMVPHIDWENRKLCSDGNCIGTIGPDGFCKVCGKPYEGELPDADIPESVADPSGDHFQKPAPLSDSPPPLSDEPDENTDLEWENRRLCSDGNCIGVIGDDNCCKLCGRPYTS